jgi:hypothetical protein
MSATHRCNRHGAQKGSHSVNSPANVGRSRSALLASASLIALAALGLSGAAREPSLCRLSRNIRRWFARHHDCLGRD